MNILMGPERRRRWSAEEKLAMVMKSFQAGMTVSMVARQHGVNPNQLFQWRKLYQSGSLVSVITKQETVEAPEMDALLEQLRELKRVLRQKMAEIEVLKKAVERRRATTIRRARRDRCSIIDEASASSAPCGASSVTAKIADRADRRGIASVEPRKVQR